MCRGSCVSADKSASQVWIENWLTAWSNKVTRYAFQVTGDRQLAQDVAQETFLRLYLFHVNHPTREVNPPWLFTVAKNVARDLLRQHRTTSPLAEADRVEDPRASASAVGLTVRDVMSRLAPDDRQCLYLFYYADLSTDDIAHHLGISPGAVRARLFRARQRFEWQWEGNTDAPLR